MKLLRPSFQAICFHYTLLFVELALGAHSPPKAVNIILIYLIG